MHATATHPLLVELLTEELPPRALGTLAESFAQTIFTELSKSAICTEEAQYQSFATPRRLAVFISHARSRAANAQKREKLLPVNIALDARGKPAAPLLKKIKSLGLNADEGFDLSQLERVHDGKQEVFFISFESEGAKLPDALQKALDEAIAKLPIPKVMNYQRHDGQTVRFVRPAHGLMAIHGDQVVGISALGLHSQRTTMGHRFHTELPITIKDAQSYAQILKTEGKVIAGYEERKESIQKELTQKALPHKAIIPSGLLDEVTSLVEWPVVLEAGFNKDFLSVPQECLILTMQQNQKYFALTDSAGNLVNRFLLVSNIMSKDPQVVISGNERVLRARLSDAKFFFDQDRKKTLASRVENLASVVYHNKIGNQRERVDRVIEIASSVAAHTGAKESHVRRAALIAKADLLTDMVGEFPELQGIMGTYYAKHDGEDEEVALAIAEHYRPRFAGDQLPETATGLSLALADKLETIVGIWGIGLAPTGDKDPFALRRHALGVIRILIEKNLALKLSDCLEIAARAFGAIAAVKPNLLEIEQFILDRLRAFLKDRDYTSEEIEAVLAQCPSELYQVPARLSAVRRFMTRQEAQSLCAANKRIGNILKKVEAASGKLDEKKLIEPSEIQLAKLLKEIGPQSAKLVAESRYEEALAGLAQLKSAVDEFFDGVMVMAEDPTLRANRLTLMRDLYQAMNQVADLSKLAI